jgi:CheY-like chemotaxis protein/HPt (histidine-containing phosphotransfer) domain-containing protein
MPYGRVLIVDDVETNIYVAKGLMAPYALKIDSADSGLAAIEIIKKGNVYDIVFMDHMMPNMDGIEATKIIRGLGYERPIVALTANAVAGQSGLFLNSGFDDFISKPIDLRQLNSVLNRLIRDKHPQEAAEAARQQAQDKKEQTVPVGQQNSIDPQFAEIFVRDASKSLAVLEAIHKNPKPHGEEDIRTYVINVHGMKSALANIGRRELSAQALKLEDAGRKGDMGTIAAETGAFLASLEALIQELSPKDEGGSDGAAEGDQASLLEKLASIKAACEAYDEKTAIDAIKNLREMKWPQPAKELLGTIAEHLLVSSFDEAVEAIDKFVAKG